MKFVIQYLQRGRTKPTTFVKTTRLRPRKGEKNREFVQRALGPSWVCIMNQSQDSNLLVWNKSFNRKKDGTPYKETPVTVGRFLGKLQREGWVKQAGSIFETSVNALTPTFWD